MKKLLATILVIGIGSGVLIFFGESNGSSMQDALWVASMSSATIFIGASLVVLLLRITTRPDLRLEERIIKENWGTYMTDSGETTEGICYLTDIRILFQPVGFTRLSKNQICVDLDRISECKRSDKKLAIDSEGVTHYFFLEDSKRWEELINP